jgi:prepilin-type processing-associated H-X9-DG protein
MPQPTEIFVFLDEHPDSIDDGYFIDTDLPDSSYSASSVPINEWKDLPASYHNNSGAFSFADGHAALHHWSQRSTIVTAAAYTANLPIMVSSSSGNADFEWIIDHMSVEN